MKRRTKTDQPVTAVGTFTGSSTAMTPFNATWTPTLPYQPNYGIPLQYPFPGVPTPNYHFGHILGDPEVVSHCPLCGSGDIVAGGDQTISCTFCNRSFLVMEQPSYNSMPGQPGATTDATMPGGGAAPGAPGDPMAPEVPGDPAAAPTDPAAGPADPPAPNHAPVNPQTDPDTLKKSPPFKFGGSVKTARQDESIFRTASGYKLGEDDFVAHVAFQVDRDFMVGG